MNNFTLNWGIFCHSIGVILLEKYKPSSTLDWWKGPYWWYTVLLKVLHFLTSINFTLKQTENELVGHYPGHGRLEFTKNLEIIDPTLFNQVPVYQVLDTTGNIICDPEEVQVKFQMFIAYKSFFFKKSSILFYFVINDWSLEELLLIIICTFYTAKAFHCTHTL